MGSARYIDGARDRGFTLVELLVALTIFVTVLASVALVFNGAVRTSKQGFQNQEVYELVRGTQKVIERDLSRTFTSRDHGDIMNFYGAPMGFTYVGLISADESSAPNMARVTYVMFHDSTMRNLSGAFDAYTYESKEGASVPTYQLLRYIEPGQDTLDSFPIDWNTDIGGDVTGYNATLNSVVEGTVALANCPDTECQNLVRQTARREIWIKMLSGGGGTMRIANANGIIVDTVPLPSAWDNPQAYLGLPVGQTIDPKDYVVAEHIRNLRAVNETCGATTDALEGSIPSGSFYESIYQNGLGDYCTIVMNDVNEPPYFGWDTTATFSLTADARPFFTYWDVGVIRNPTNPNIEALDQHTPVAFRFWNDARNMIADGLDNDGDNDALRSDNLDNDGDGTIDEPDEGIDEADEVYAENAGSPMDARLPVAVTTDFTLFFRSPYPGAPDFNERFTQRIDLPTAYRRAFKNTAATP